jgi:hypothetical protein
VAKGQAKEKKRLKGIGKAVDRLTKKEEVGIDEARRGRPRKDGSTPEDLEGGREHIQIQLRKVINLRGAKKLEFDNNEKMGISPNLARKMLTAIDHSGRPRDKQNLVKFISKSAKNFNDVLAGKKVETDPVKVRQDNLKRGFAEEYKDK